MTTTASGRKQTSACNGVTTIFPVNFQFIANADLRVYLHDESVFDPETATLLTEGVHYALTGTGRAGTASVSTLGAPLPNGKYLTRYRVTSRAQGADYVPNDGFAAESHETQLDRLSLVDEELQQDGEDLNNAALRVQRGETIRRLPPPNGRNNRLITFGKVPNTEFDGQPTMIEVRDVMQTIGVRIEDDGPWGADDVPVSDGAWG